MITGETASPVAFTSLDSKSLLIVFQLTHIQKHQQSMFDGLKWSKTPCLMVELPNKKSTSIILIHVLQHILHLYYTPDFYPILSPPS